MACATPRSQSNAAPPIPVHTLRVTFLTPTKVRARAVDHLAVAIGTTNGLFLVSDGAVDGPFFAKDSVGAFAQLEGRLLTASTGRVSGTVMRASDDGGLNWIDQTPLPIADGAGLSVVRQLHIDRRPGSARTIWAGAEPALLLRSTDGGHSFELVKGLLEHPDRAGWTRGSCEVALHSVLTHPKRPDRILAAITTGGIYRSDDGGESWASANHGIEPTDDADGTLCVHSLAVDAVNPDMVWAQTHSGTYRSEDAGEHWESVVHLGEATGLPSEFGYPIVTHPVEPATAYVIPLQSEDYAVTQGRCRVYRTTNAGKSWEALADGLPGPHAYLSVLNNALTIGSEPPYPIVFGSQSGHVFASQDGGDTWRLVASYLPPILCVRVLD